MPLLVTNIAFRESAYWRANTRSICTGDETPDDLSTIKQVFRLLCKRRQAALVITMGARVSLCYGLACALLRLPSKQVMLEVFLDEPSPANPIWQLKAAGFRRAARRACGIICNSSLEVGYTATRFRIPEAKVRFVPMYTTIATPAAATQDKDFILSAGRTLRDLHTILKAAPRFEMPLLLIAGKHDRIPNPIPPNVKVLRDIPLAEYHQLLRECSFVIIPLLPAWRSTGQVVMFEAMGLGKPVIATRTTGTVDYIRNKENGLLVPPEDPAALINAVSLLRQNPALGKRLAGEALEEAHSNLSIDAYAHRLLDAIRTFLPTP